MTLTHILVFSLFSLLVGWLVPLRWRGWLLLGSSVIAVYWLQSSTPVRNLDFWFPTASIALTVFVWAVVSSKAVSGLQFLRSNQVSALVILGLILAVGLTRYLGPFCCLTQTRPPELHQVFLALGLGSVVAAIPARLAPGHRFLPGTAMLIIIALFVVLKTEPLGQVASAGLRTLNGQSAALASHLDLGWLGFSYLAFRLLHTVRDAQAGKLPPYSLGEFVTYAIFFPTYTAGPIDRSQRFIADLREPRVPAIPTQSLHTDPGNLFIGSQRVLIGIFKKFVLADSLALVALNERNALQANASLWMWILLYAYTLRIYFDFSGYTDIALGLGRLLGFNLPENFNRPYLRQNLTAFWSSWHITLAQWFRAYFFNPVTRALRTRPEKLPVWAAILAGQLGTMLLIGLWHGITWNFAAWGIWHGLGLFVHNRWSDKSRSRLPALMESSQLQPAFRLAGWFLTFHYVALGWVWFALPNPGMALNVFRTLLGLPR